MFVPQRSMFVPKPSVFVPQRSMGRVVLVLALMLCVAVPARADPDDATAGGTGAQLKARAQILAAEMRRRSVDLAPFLRPDGDRSLRRLAIRALGRIGDDGSGPGILRDMLATQSQDLDLLIWAAGIARSEDLAAPLADELAERLGAGDLEHAAAAAQALGWKGGALAGEKLLPLLGHESAQIRRAALIGLGRARFAERAGLEAASKRADDDDAVVCRAAEFACWLMARAYARKVKKEDEAWDGEPKVAARFLKHLAHYDPERRMGGIRVLGLLLPKSCAADGPFGAIYKLVEDDDPRVVQDAIGRIFTQREGDAVDTALVAALQQPDPKTRSASAKALGAHASPMASEALARRFEVETDARVREDLTIELARVGQEAYWKKLQAGQRAEDPVVRQMTDAQVLLLSQRPEALAELMRFADPGASQRASLHAATWMAVLSGVEEKEGEVQGLDTWLMGFLDGGYAIDRDERPFVVATAIGVVGSKKRHALAPKLLEILGRSGSGTPPHDEIHETRVHGEIRQALMGAFADLAADEGCAKDLAAAMKKAIGKHMREDPSPWVRLKAREAARALELGDVPAYDAQQPTEWQGVPRAAVRNPALDPALDPALGPTGDATYLDEAGILQIADWIRANDPTIVFETTVGTFTVGLDAVAAPVHAVSLLNAVRNGVYDGTRWHRVVPNFVIQGGDPHGHGGGGGGWRVPDEINPLPYVRGALGMPKSVKDDGGCQLFFMLSAYHPLDERYTCYGRVRSGMDCVDRIRVGDFIQKASVVVRVR